MNDLATDMFATRRPTAERPLLGQTILVVEDSRHAGEAMRLICLRGGARIRRADSLRAASRHLSTYRPTVVIVDLGLPDGSGLDLIRQLADGLPRVPVLLAVSGDPDLHASALDAGADGFLTKPFGSIAAFHSEILGLLPREDRPLGPRLVHDEEVEPDPAALMEDYALVADLLDPGSDSATVTYALNFARGLARASSDDDLLAAVAATEGALDKGEPVLRDLSRLAGLVQTRLGEGRVAV